MWRVGHGKGMTATESKNVDAVRCDTVAREKRRERARDANPVLAGAKLGAQLLFQRGDDARGEIVDLRVG